METGKNKTKKYVGFSLMEMIVAIFVFSLIMTTVVATFVSVINSRKKMKAVQQDVEDARFAMELMAKSLRTSSVLKCDGSAVCGATATDLLIYDYSQEKCVEYKFDSATHALKSGMNDLNTSGDITSGCKAISLLPITNGNINGVVFAATQSTSTPPKEVGKVTIALKVCYNNVCSGTGGDTTTIQTTVSLRDYQEVNP